MQLTVRHQNLPAFPLSERSLYSYLRALHDNPNSSASVGRSFLEAVRFSAAMLGLHGLDRDKVPQRVSGLAELLAKRATCVKQASPLTVQQVATLESTWLHCRGVAGQNPWWEAFC